MQGIGDFLKKYLNFTPPARVKSQAVLKAITERFGVTLDEGAIEIRGNRIFVRANAALKSEISLNKKQILLRANELGAKGIEELS